MIAIQPKARKADRTATCALVQLQKRQGMRWVSGLRSGHRPMGLRTRQCAGACVVRSNIVYPKHPFKEDLTHGKS